MIAPPEFLIELLKPWNDFYGHSKVAETSTSFLHVARCCSQAGLRLPPIARTLRALRLKRKVGCIR
jgi:hypothetical protein